MVRETATNGPGPNKRTMWQEMMTTSGPEWYSTIATLVWPAKALHPALAEGGMGAIDSNSWGVLAEKILRLGLGRAEGGFSCTQGRLLVSA